MGRLYFLILLVIGVAAAGLSHLSMPAAGPARAPSPNGVATFVEPSATTPTEPAQAQAMTDDSSVALNRNADGHFYADVEINGVQIHMLVDTGATGIALTREDAASAGLAQSIEMSDVVGSGAEGDVHGEYVMLDRVALGPKSLDRVPAVILGSGSQSLLGQAFLRQFGTVEIAGDTMRLQ